MPSDVTANIELLILEAWDMGMINSDVVDHVLSEVTVSRDIIATVMIDLINRMA